MMKYIVFIERITAILALFMVGLCCFSPSLLSAETSVRRPMVAILPLESPGGSMSYVGPAVTQMLDTRLASEGIDTFIVPSAGNQTEAVSLADFMVDGKITEDNNIFDAEIALKKPSGGEVLKVWHLKAVSLDALAQNAALFSVKLADTIKHAEQVLIPLSGEGGAAENSADADLSKDDFAMARLHPDKLVREQLKQDEEKELEAQRQKTEEQRQQEQQLALKNKKSDDENWFPLPDVYDADTDEPAEPETEAEVPAPEEANASAGSVSASTGQAQDKKSWFSRLWPFGSDKNAEQESWKKERAKLEENEAETGREAKVVPEDDVPYPPPRQVKFEIPEPVPLDEALARVDKMYAGSKPQPEEDEGWFSWLWPWGSKESSEAVSQATLHKQEAVQGKIEQGSEMHGMMDSMINNISAEKAKAGTESQEQVQQQRQEHVRFTSVPVSAQDNEPQETSVSSLQGAQAKPVDAATAEEHIKSAENTVSATMHEYESSDNEAVADSQAEAEAETAETDQALSDGTAAENTESEGAARNFDGPIWKWY